MLAIRSAGLSFSSLIGVCNAPSTAEDEDEISENGIGEEHIRALVSEEYLEILVGVANQRFSANRERIARFERGVFGKAEVGGAWEDGDCRRERMRKEGLARREALGRGVRGEGGKPVEKDGQVALADDVFSLPLDLGNGV